MAFLVAEQRQQAEGGVRGVGGRGEQPGQPVGEALYGRAVEEVGTELEEAADAAAGLLARVEGEVELGRAGRHGGQPCGGLRAQCERGVRYGLPGEHRLEQGVPGQRAPRVQLLDEVVEGQRVVLVRGEGGGPYPLQECAESGVAGGVGAQHDGVGEEADEGGGGVVGAAGDGCAEGDVGAAAVPGQEGGEARLHGHEDAGAGGTGEALEGGVGGGVEAEGDGVARVRGDGRTRPVGGQVELVGQPGEGLLPVRELGGGERGGFGGRAEELLLPGGVVGVLEGQRRELRFSARVPGGVGGGEVAGEGRGGGAVTGYVVQQQEQGVAVGAVAEQRGAERGFGGQVEAVAYGLGEVVGTGLGEVRLRPRQRVLGGKNPLVGLLLPAVVSGRIYRSECLVASGQVAQGELECATVDRSVDAQHERDVVGGAGAFEPVEEPEALLGGREGEVSGAG